jgi:hypothetical protein
MSGSYCKFFAKDCTTINEMFKMKHRVTSIKASLYFLKKRVWNRKYITGTWCGWISWAKMKKEREKKTLYSHEMEVYLRHSVEYWKYTIKMQPEIIVKSSVVYMLVSGMFGIPWMPLCVAEHILSFISFKEWQESALGYCLSPPTSEEDVCSIIKERVRKDLNSFGHLEEYYRDMMF